MKKFVSLIVGIMSICLISACANNVSPNTYESSEVGVVNKVIPGVIIGKRAVKIEGKSNVGGLAGAAAGATGGSAIGGSTRGNLAGAIGGAIIGGVVGNAADKAVYRHKGFEYIIKLKNNSIISVTQLEDAQFKINQRVLVIYGAMTRIVPDNTETK